MANLDERLTMLSIDDTNTCCHPGCDGPLSEAVRSPMCDRHTQSVYLAVKSLVDQATPEHHIQSAGYRNASGRPDGTVYFVRKGGYIKIGFTRNLTERLRSLGCKPTDVVATMPGRFCDEANLHARFAHLRDHGEWFRIDPDLVSLIAALWLEQAA